MSRRAPTWVWGSLLVAVCGVAACGRVLGADFSDLVPAEVGGAGMAGAAASMESEDGDEGCEPGQRRCDGLLPQICVESGLWTPRRAPCAIGCADGDCIHCEAGEARCRDGALQACEAGNWVTHEVCDQVCEAGSCVDACAAPGRLQCNATTLQSCDGSGYVDEQSCQYSCVEDNAGNANCAGECVHDDVRCDSEGHAQACAKDGEWDEAGSTACEHGTTCVSGHCMPCAPEARRCAESGPQQCNESGVWVNQGACSGDTEACLDGECVVCAPGDRRCADNDLEQCETSGAGWVLAEACTGDSPACLADQLACGACSAGDTQCSGNNVQSCEGGSWTTLVACASPNPECVDGSCRPCRPGQRRCLDENTWQVCQNDGNWSETENCSGDTPVCRADLNFACGCTEGERRCRGLQPEVCETGSWVAEGECTEHCLAATGQCVDCQPDTETCEAATAHRCTQAGSWESLNSCLGSQVNCGSCGIGESCPGGNQDCETGVCVDGVCRACSPGASSCLNGTTPRECNPAGSWETKAACSSATPVCQAGACVACSEGESRSCGACDRGVQQCSNGSWGDCVGASVARSCANTPSCGVDDESCCRSNWVEGGSYMRGTGFEATVGDFCLDKYEVTVGRFREFVANYDSFSVEPGAGEHLPGAGTGWQSSWDDLLPATSADLTANVGEFCGYYESSRHTWRDNVGSADNERKPINCLSWYLAFAFCVWDGGRLPTEAEWEYAAGGGQDWAYPWGNAAPSTDVAIYGGCGTAPCGDHAYEDIMPVGLRPAGNGFWGHSDLSGNIMEWVFDWYVEGTEPEYPRECNNCANTTAAVTRSRRGASFDRPAAELVRTTRNWRAPEARTGALGLRCVRVP